MGEPCKHYWLPKGICNNCRQDYESVIAALEASLKDKEAENAELREELDACKTVIACPDCSITICDEHTEQLQEGARSGGK